VTGATAIAAGAELPTANPADFERLVAVGLELAD
jgi:predicted nucleic acid-binding protein